jgi:ubiquilin
MLRTASMLQSTGLGPENFVNPFSLPPQTGQADTAQPATQMGAQGADSPPGHTANSPFGMIDPGMLQQLFGGYGGLPTALGGASNTPNPANTRPPEERFEEQLRQLREMGFVNTTQNVRALLATGGNIQMAIEYILGGGGL